MSPQITIIIPIYNTEDQLKDCLNSVICQTYRNWNCLLIDDGSSDYSGKICNEYASKDSRFQVFHKQNQGVNLTRNFGLCHAEGEYIAFVDSDDWLDSNYLEFLASNISDGVDMVMCHAIFEYPDSSVEVLKIKPDIIICNDNNKNDYILSSISRAYSKNVLHEEHGFLNTVWGKLYRKKTIMDNKLLFTELPLNEDAIFNLYFFEYAKSFKIYNKVLYHYRMRESSAVHSFKKDYIDIYNIYLNEVKNFIDKYYRDNKLFKDTWDSLITTALFKITKDYFYNPECSNNVQRKKEMQDLVNKEPYKDVIKRFNGSLAKNKEVSIVLYVYKLKALWILKWYFSFRPRLKSVFIRLKRDRY